MGNLYFHKISFCVNTISSMVICILATKVIKLTLNAFLWIEAISINALTPRKVVFTPARQVNFSYNNALRPVEEQKSFAFASGHIKITHYVHKSSPLYNCSQPTDKAMWHESITFTSQCHLLTNGTTGYAIYFALLFHSHLHIILSQTVLVNCATKLHL